MRVRIGLIVGALLAGLIAGCGGGSSSSLTSSNPVGGAPVTLSGTISAFGSVVMNGIHYDVSAAAMTLNGSPVSQTGLAVGQVAHLHGQLSSDGKTGVADRVEVEDQVIGPVSAVDATAGTLTVLGQNISVDSNTSFATDISPASLTAIAVGDMLGISGLIAADGHIAATRIERESAGHILLVQGTVAGLDTTNFKFMINGLTVNYGTASFNGFSSGTPANGDLVLVQGSSFDSTTVTLTASSVAHAYSDVKASTGDHSEREGLITRFVSATDFDVAQQPVTTTTSTVYVNGTVADLALNLHVEVEGTIDASGVLVADKLIVIKAGIAELKGNVTAIDTTAGTITLLGIKVTVTADTRLEDDSSAHVQQLSLADLAVGDTVEVRGYEDPVGSGAITATRLERESPQTTVVVGGYFQPTMAPQFTVLGITVDASAATFATGEDHSGTTLTSAQFFAQAPGKVVFVKGTLNGGTVMAAQVLLVSHEDCSNGY